MYAEGAPIPLVIYRVNPKEAYELGVWACVEEPANLPPNPFFDLSRPFPAQIQGGGALPSRKPIAALTNLEGIRRSHKERKLWLLHPQSNELSLYRGEPQLLALWQSYGFYEAYLPHDSSAVPHEWSQTSAKTAPKRRRQKPI